MIELILPLVFYVIPALYLIYKARKNNADRVAYSVSLFPIFNIVVAVYVLWYFHKYK